MASFPCQEQRPIKRPRLSNVGPDVYPQESKQKEDELTHSNVKHGYDTRPPCEDETGLAFRRASFDPNILTEEKINRYFTEILQEKVKSNTIPADQGKKKLQLNTRDNFSPVTPSTKTDPWMKDLAGTKPLTILAKKVPIFAKKDEIYKHLADYNVPMERAVWLVKMTNGYYQTLAESRVRQRRNIDSHAEWTAVSKEFLKTQLQKIFEFTSHDNTSAGYGTNMNFKYWNYGTQLVRQMFEDGLLEKDNFLSWLVEQLEKHKPAEELIMKMTMAQIIRYLSDIVQSQLLSRRLAHFCCKQLSQYCQESGVGTPRTQSPLVTASQNGNMTTGSANASAPQTTSTLPSVFAEYANCPQHRGMMLTFSVIVQAITLRCPGALIWHNLGEGKMNANLSGSPLDILPCAPSCLPMPYGIDNEQIRSQIRASEVQIRLRSRMSESRWSSDKCQQSAKGFTIAKVLQVLETLDTQNFTRIEKVNFIDFLYHKIFGVLESKENEPPISDECIVNVLCEWAMSIQRTGEYRALVVAKLLEKRQNEINPEKQGEDDITDHKGSEAGSEVLGTGSTPAFQNILLNFLDNKAPFLDESSSLCTRRAFSNLILLFCELVKYEVFSHDAYMCTLISRGDLADAPTLRPLPGPSTTPSTANISSVLSAKPEESKLDLDFDMFMKDEPKPSPSRPASVKSEQPFSVPTPGAPPHTPMYGMARTPGAPTTPSMSMGARTPGAPHTPGGATAAHTPMGAPTTPGHGGLTPAYGSAHTPAPMQPPTPRMSVTPAAHQISVQSMSEDSALRARKHFSYAMHFPIALDDTSNHECNQRMVLLYGFGKARDDVRHNIKKITREVLKLYSKKASVDVTLGEVRRRDKKKEKEGETSTATATTAPTTTASYESIFQKFQRLSYHDQHAVTHQCSSQVSEMIQEFIAGRTVVLPQIEHVSYLFDLMEHCHNVSGLVEFLVQLLGELKHVHDRLLVVGSQMEINYTTSLCLCIISVLRRYHAYLLVMEEEYTSPVFENVCQIVKHVGNPAECSSAERCTLAYLYDLFTTCAYVKDKYSELFSGAAAKLKAALFARLRPADSNEDWNMEFMQEELANPIIRPETDLVQQLADHACRFSFVCNTILEVANCGNNMERLNDMAILCAELTSRLNSLSHEWLGVLRALCCSSQSHGSSSQGYPKYGFIELLQRLDICDVSKHEPLAKFTSILVARHCFSLQDLIIHVALPVIVNPDVTTGTEAEVGARLTCHLLLRLFQSTRGTPDSRYKQDNIRCDRHLLDAAHQACGIEPVVAFLKALIMMTDQISSTNKKTQESQSDIIQTLMKSLDDGQDDDEFLGFGPLTGLAIGKSKQGVEHACLSEYARYVLKEICKQDWVREKFLKKPEDLLSTELLLDATLTPKQVQQLVHMICYPDGIPEGPSSLASSSDEDEISDQRKNISRILHNVDQWRLRVSWLELQLMFKQSPNSELSHLLDNVAEATIEVFTSQTGHHGHPGSRDMFSSNQNTWSETDKDSIWLIAPLIAKLPTNVQGRVLSAAGEKLKTGNNFWTAKNASEKERYIQESISLMGHQPFLSLVLTCLKGQDEKREGLLKSLHEQLEKFVNNTKEPQDRGIPTDDRLKLMMQESLRLRMSLVGGMFDTIQRNSSLFNEWTLILIQLISHGVVELGNNAELFMVVLDMLSILLHGTLVADEPDGKPDLKMYQSLVRKLKREIGEKQSDSMDLVRQLLPLPKLVIEVLQTEPHKTKKMQGFQIGAKQKLSPWDLLEGHKPAPLSLAWFGGVKIERQPLHYEEQHRLLLYHTHSMKKPISHYLDRPKLPEEDLEPPAEQNDNKVEIIRNPVQDPMKADSGRMKKKKQGMTRGRGGTPNPYPNAPIVPTDQRGMYPAPGWNPYPQGQPGMPNFRALPSNIPDPRNPVKTTLYRHINNRGMPNTSSTMYGPGQSAGMRMNMSVMRPRMAHPSMGRTHMGMGGHGMVNPNMQGMHQMGQGGNFGFHAGMEQASGSGQGFNAAFTGSQSGMANMQGMGAPQGQGQYGRGQFQNQSFMNTQGGNMSGMSGNAAYTAQYGGMNRQQSLQMQQMRMQQQQQQQHGMTAASQQHMMNPQLHRGMSNTGASQTQPHPPPNYNQFGGYQ